MILHHPIEKWVKQQTESILVQDRLYEYYYNALMSFVSRHPIMKIVIQKCVKNISR